MNFLKRSEKIDVYDVADKTFYLLNPEAIFIKLLGETNDVALLQKSMK